MSQNTAPSFAELGVPAKLVDVLSQQNLTAAFPIQTATLPDSLAGRDVLGRGRTGSGKTLAFVLPLVARLSASGQGPRSKTRRPRGLILAPTRELANQIADVIGPLGHSLGLVTTTIFGGVSQSRQVSALRAGVDIVVACPGRLEDLMQQGLLSLDGIEITVLDEADHMADLGFLPGVRRIMSATPAKGQRLLFSATLDSAVKRLVDQFMRSPSTHSVDSGQPAVSTMTHRVFLAQDQVAKRDLVEALASGRGSRLLFTRTKHQAKRLAQQLTKAGIPAVDMHGNLSQNARERNLSAFSSGRVKVLVATDIAARGLHIDDVELVVHVDPPAEFKAYLHRSGRTARAGAAGTVVTVILPEQRQEMRTLARDAKIKVTPLAVDANSREVLDLVGERADYVQPETPTQAGPSGKVGATGGANPSGKPGRSRRSGSGRGGRAELRAAAGRAGSAGSAEGRRGSAAGGDGRPGANGRPGAKASRPGSSGSAASAGGGARKPRRPRNHGAARSGENNPQRGHAQRSGGEAAKHAGGQGLVAMSRSGGSRRGR